MQRHTNQLMNVKYFKVLFTQTTARHRVLLAGAESKDKKHREHPLAREHL
jgi:hypothetical protein